MSDLCERYAQLNVAVFECASKLWILVDRYASPLTRDESKNSNNENHDQNNKQCYGINYFM